MNSSGVDSVNHQILTVGAGLAVGGALLWSVGAVFNRQVVARCGQAGTALGLLGVAGGATWYAIRAQGNPGVNVPLSMQLHALAHRFPNRLAVFGAGSVLGGIVLWKGSNTLLSVRSLTGLSTIAIGATLLARWVYKSEGSAPGPAPVVPACVPIDQLETEAAKMEQGLPLESGTGATATSNRTALPTIEEAKEQDEELEQGLPLESEAATPVASKDTSVPTIEDADEHEEGQGFSEKSEEGARVTTLSVRGGSNRLAQGTKTKAPSGAVKSWSDNRAVQQSQRRELFGDAAMKELEALRYRAWQRDWEGSGTRANSVREFKELKAAESQKSWREWTTRDLADLTEGQIDQMIKDQPHLFLAMGEHAEMIEMLVGWCLRTDESSKVRRRRAQSLLEVIGFCQQNQVNCHNFSGTFHTDPRLNAQIRMAAAEWKRAVKSDLQNSLTGRNSSDEGSRYGQGMEFIRKVTDAMEKTAFVQPEALRNMLLQELATLPPTVVAAERAAIESGAISNAASHIVADNRAFLGAVQGVPLLTSASHASGNVASLIGWK